MSTSKYIVCLANSIKHHPNRCIAGKEWIDAQVRPWVRPVSDDVENEGAISLDQSKLDNGAQPRLMDVITIPVATPTPKNCQTENWLISGQPWVYRGRILWPELQSLIDTPDELWTLGNSTNNGLNDRLSIEQAGSLANSLYLIQPEDLRIIISIEGAAFGKERPVMRAKFSYRNTQYILGVTDPFFKNKIREFAVDVEHVIGNAIICVSISDLFKAQNAHYKLVASIITPERAQ